MELNIADIIDRVADTAGSREALVFRDRRLTWADFSDRCNRFGAALETRGLGARGTAADVEQWESIHDHVALYLFNGNEYLEAMIGSYMARCGPININYRYKADELFHVLEDSGSQVIVHHARFAPLLAEVVPRLTRSPLLVAVDDDTPGPLPTGTVAYEDFLAEAPASVSADTRSSRTGDDLYLCYTGGTTGMPKGVLWRQADFVVAALGFRGADGDEFGSYDDVAASAASSTLRALPAPPLMHGAAHWNALSCLFAGGTVIIQSDPTRLDPADIWATVERERATSLLVVGDPFARPLLAELDEGRYDTSSLRHVLSGGAILTGPTKDALAARLDGVTIVDVLGSSESGRQAVARTSRTRSAGFQPEQTAVVLDVDRRRRLQPHEHEIGWLGQSGRVPLGYLGDRTKTEATFPHIDGSRLAVAGDRARWSADGTIELLGRDSVCINTGGEKVFAEEVETVVLSHPAVRDAVVAGRPSERWGEEVIAVIALRPAATATPAEIVAHCRGRLADFKAPKHVVVVPEVVRSPSGKADYRWAKEQARTQVPSS